MTKIHKGINGFMEKPQQFINLLNGTGLVSWIFRYLVEQWLMEKYNKMDPPSFAISPAHLAISVKAPRMKDAFHTREDVYIFDVTHPHHIKPVHLTHHDHGAISGLAFSPDGSKLAWLEMAQDGYESDRRVAVVHDTKNAIRWTDTWDRSPSSITVSCGMLTIADSSGL
jgi:dipeptidyl aminopeptidase/acylaminoacyl peptidase